MIEIKTTTMPATPRSKKYPVGASVLHTNGGTTIVQGGSGGGESVDIIKEDDIRSFTDANVLSSLRALTEFVSKSNDDDISAIVNYLNGLKIKNNQVNRLLLKDTEAGTMTDTDVMSALRVLAEISANNEDLSGKFLSKLRPDETPHLLKLLGGLYAENGIHTDTLEASGSVLAQSVDATETISGKNVLASESVAGENVIASNTVSGNNVTAHESVSGKSATISQKTTTLNLLVQSLADTYDLNVSHVATMFQTIVKDYVSSELYIPGLTGSGMKLYKALSGDWNLELDNVTVRKAMTIFELIISKIRAVNGGLVISPANGRIKSVAETTDSYVLGIEGDMMFVLDDFVRCQVFTANQLKYYWVRVTRVDGELIHVLKSDFPVNVVPSEGDDLIQFGNKTNAVRQGVLYLTASEDGKPRFSVLDGVNSTDLTGKTKVILGCLDSITDTAFSADSQPSGYGLYSTNVFLKGIFVLRNGKTFEDELNGQITAVQTAFEIREGVISSKVTEATTAATNAKKSETSASGSASTAASSANAAAGSATAAQKAEKNAENVLEEVTTKESSITQTAGQISTKVTEVNKKATEAATSATAAANSATSAKGAADTATAKLTTISEKESSINQTAGQISTKVTEVTKKASEASISATNAASSATTAGTKATAAANSATAAAGSATNAKSSADSAAAKLTTITQKESSINQTASQISTKVTEVNTKASQAATSATNASNSATAASGSASTATTKATAAANSAELATAMSKGKMLYRDPSFKSGLNSCSVYNNSNNGTVTVTRVSGVAGNPNSSGYCLKVNTTGAASPALGGFVQAPTVKANQCLVYRIIANIPTGRTLAFARNGAGNGVSERWLTSTAGTGKWEEYAYKLNCGTSGTFSSCGHFYLSGGATPTASTPLTWHIAYATVFDTTDAEIDYIADAAGKYTTKTEHTSSITQLSNSIELKVAKTDFNALGTRVSSAETTIRQHTDQIAVKAAKTDVTALGTRVTAAEAKITPDAIKLTVKSQTDTIAANAANSAVNGVQVGGRNYFISSSRKISYSGGLTYVANHNDCPYGFYAVGDQDAINMLRISGVIKSNGWWTVSWEMRGSQNTPVNTRVDICDTGNKIFATTNNNTWKRYSLTVNVTNYGDGSIYNFVDFENFSWAYFFIRNIKVEQGNKATDWTPAPEDVQTDINLRPTTDAIKASLTIDTGGISLLGKKISLTGMVTYSSLDSAAQSTISSDATTKANNARNDVAVKMGYSSYTDMVNKAASGQTIINGGYIRTSLIDANAVVTNNLLATKIAATAITTGKLTVTTGAKIGGWSVDGNSISIRSAASAKILVEPSGYRFLRINDTTSELMSIRADGVTGIGIYTQDTTGKCLRLSAQTGGTAIESYGNISLTARLSETISMKGDLCVEGLHFNCQSITLANTRIGSNITWVVCNNTRYINPVFLPLNPRKGRIIFIYQAGDKVTLSTSDGKNILRFGTLRTWHDTRGGGHLHILCWDGANWVMFDA